MVAGANTAAIPARRDAVDVPVPWTTTVMNRAYQQLLDSFNVDVSVAVPRVIQGTVTAGGATLLANGRSSVPITLVVEASPGPALYACASAPA